MILGGDYVDQYSIRVPRKFWDKKDAMLMIQYDIMEDGRPTIEVEGHHVMHNITINDPDRIVCLPKLPKPAESHDVASGMYYVDDTWGLVNQGGKIADHPGKMPNPADPNARWIIVEEQNTSAIALAMRGMDWVSTGTPEVTFDWRVVGLQHEMYAGVLLDQEPMESNLRMRALDAEYSSFQLKRQMKKGVLAPIDELISAAWMVKVRDSDGKPVEPIEAVMRKLNGLAIEANQLANAIVQFADAGLFAPIRTLIGATLPKK